jgi:hypothetical protein
MYTEIDRPWAPAHKTRPPLAVQIPEYTTGRTCHLGSCRILITKERKELTMGLTNQGNMYADTWVHMIHFLMLNNARSCVLLSNTIKCIPKASSDILKTICRSTADKSNSSITLQC